MLKYLAKENKELGEVNLITEFRHEILNFRKDFNINARNTLLLTPYASNLFGFGLINGKPAFGVPDTLTEATIWDPLQKIERIGTLWDLMIRTRWFGVFAKPNSSAVYWLFEYMSNDEKKKMAFRLEMRKQRVNIILEAGEVTFVRMNDLNSEEPYASNPDGEYQSFSLQAYAVDSLFWEMG